MAIILHSGSSFAQDPTAAKGSSTTKSSTAGKASPTGRRTAAPVKKASTASPVVLKDQKDKLSYALGMNMGTNLHANLQRDAIDVDPNIVLQGIKDAMTGGKLMMTEAEARAALTQLQQNLMAKQREAMAKEEEKMKAAAEPNKKEGEAFLVANKTKEGVVTLPSGLQYKVLTEGKGAKPTVTDTVVCNYRGTLINGTEFDSSYKQGEPASFQVSRVIKGWTEALQLMPVGSKWQLFIPSDLAYAERGTPGGSIGPNSTLIFEVELLSIEGK
ncbi:MAG TPA: FKBP-type peptidyl-prolyl cis-trans isomerase [Candidatus Angelobacter sp.]|nr:FKBP-type peptidyl-prolyl cis-trans isomerase [Candidatus Angelobacter sp.]